MTMFLLYSAYEIDRHTVEEMFKEIHTSEYPDEK